VSYDIIKEICLWKVKMEEPIEIVKRIPEPKSATEPKTEYSRDTAEPKHEHIRETTEPQYEPPYEPPESYSNNHTIVKYYDDSVDEKKPIKKILLALVGVTIAGAVGYVGVNKFTESKPEQTPNQLMTKSEENNLKIEKEVIDHLQEKNNYYVEALAVAKTTTNKPVEVPEAPKTSSEKKEEAKDEEKQPLLKEKVQIEETKAPEIKKIEITELEKIEQEIKKVETEAIPVVKKKRIVHEEKIAKRERVVIPQRTKKPRHIVRYEAIRPRLRTIKRGDTLRSISKRFYGDPKYYKKLIRANPRIRNSRSSLHLGEKIIIPRKDNKRRRRFILVKRGDTLASISRNIYHTIDKIPTIVRANYRIKSKYSTLRPGQKIYIPR